jgi:hypothetical protein
MSGLHLDELSEEAFNTFPELYHKDEFQMADDFRHQICLAAHCIHRDGLTIPFSEIGQIFGALKATIMEHY